MFPCFAQLPTERMKENTLVWFHSVTVGTSGIDVGSTGSALVIDAPPEVEIKKKEVPH